MIQEIFLKRAANIRKEYLRITRDINSYEKNVRDLLGALEQKSTDLDSLKNKLDSNTKRLIKEFLDKIKDEDTYKDNIDGTTYSSFKSYNEHKVKILIYNNSDKIFCFLFFL